MRAGTCLLVLLVLRVCLGGAAVGKMQNTSAQQARSGGGGGGSAAEGGVGVTDGGEGEPAFPPSSVINTTSAATKPLPLPTATNTSLTLHTLSTTSLPPSTASSNTSSLIPSTNTQVDNTPRVGNIIYSMWGFLLGGMLTYLSLSDTFRLPLIQAIDEWTGSHRRHRRRHSPDQGLHTYVAAIFTTLTKAFDRINEVCERISKL